MFTSRDLKAIITEARPIVERQLDDAVLVSGFREKVTAQGGDWSQVKALVKAMIQDERDEAGGHKRVLAILHKADHALGYADMLGLGNLNEKNSFEDEPEHDAENGEVIDMGNPISANSRSIQAAPPSAGDAVPTSSAGTEGEADRQPIIEPAATAPAAEAARGGSVVDPSIVAAAPTNVVPMRKQVRHSDAPDPRCQNPGGPNGCGGFSNLSLCQKCKVAAGLILDGSAA